MSHQNNSIKAKIWFFYDKAQIINDPENKQIIGIGDATRDNNYICGMCYDMDNQIIDAHISYSSNMKFGRHHNCKGSNYCSKIFNEMKTTDSLYIKNIDLDKLVNLLHFNINNNFHIIEKRLYYFYKANCCLMNPTKNKKSTDKHTKGTHFHMNCEIKATQDYVLFIEETRKVLFYFNEGFDLSPFKDCLILYVNKHGFLRAMLCISTKPIVDCIYSEYNINRACNDCLLRSETYLTDTHYYIPTQYKNKHDIIPEKSKYIHSLIESDSVLLDYKCMLLIIDSLKKHNLYIDPSKLNNITLLQYEIAKKTHDTSVIEKVIDNLYYLIYGFTFTYGLCKSNSYDFITELFLFIHKTHDPNSDINYSPVYFKTIHKYIENPVKYKNTNKASIDYGLIKEYYNNEFIPNIFNVMNNIHSITKKIKQSRTNILREIHDSVRRVEDDKPIKKFNENYYCKYANTYPYNKLPNKIYRCKDTEKYLKFEKLKFSLLLHFSVDYKKDSCLKYTYFTKDQIGFLEVYESIFWTKHDYIDSIDEALLDKAYDIFQINNDYDVIKNMRSNFKYPYYIISYELNKKLRFVENCNVKMYNNKNNQNMESHQFITDYLPNKLLSTNSY